MQTPETTPARASHSRRLSSLGLLTPRLLAGWTIVLLGVSAFLLAPTAATGRERLALRHTPIQLPGPPATLLSTDLDADGVRDLVVVVAYIHWEQIGTFEEVDVDEIEGVVEVMTVVPALFDRRELFVFLGQPGGGFDSSIPPIELPPSVIALEEGPRGLPVLALTDEGLSRLVLESADPAAAGGLANGSEAPGPVNANPGPATQALVPRLEPFLAAPSLLSGAATFLPTLDLLQDFDGDGEVDLLLPVGDRHHLTFAQTLLAAANTQSPPADRTEGPDGPDGRVGAAPPPDRILDLWEEELPGLTRHVPLPLLRDLDGDSLPELVVRERSASWRTARIRRNLGNGRFAPAQQPFLTWPAIDESEVTVLHVGDLDQDGRAEVITQRNLSDLEAGMRKSMKQAKKPPMRQAIYAMDDTFAPASRPHLEFRSVGYAATEEEEEGYEDFSVPGGFEDLDGDGRLDLITVTLDFSLLQAVRVLTTQSLSIGMDFHLYCQDEAGRFRDVAGLDLSGKFKLRLDDLRIGQLSQFAGDFDGDGRRDFVQMGRGRSVTVHLGQPGCRYAPQPDLTLRLEEEPKNLALVRIDDFDGDGLSDLLVLQPQKPDEPGLTPPVRIDLYQSLGTPQ